MGVPFHLLEDGVTGAQEDGFGELLEVALLDGGLDDSFVPLLPDEELPALVVDEVVLEVVLLPLVEVLHQELDGRVLFEEGHWLWGGVHHQGAGEGVPALVQLLDEELAAVALVLGLGVHVEGDVDEPMLLLEGKDKPV